MNKISKKDEYNLKLIRENVKNFIKSAAEKHDHKNFIILDIAPQDHEGAQPYFVKSKVETLDIDPESGATYIADLCEVNEEIIPSNYFNVIICTEVFEHTLLPFEAAKEIYRILKPGGYAYISTPYNLRIHGPLPDCWRFTELGLRSLFNAFNIIDVRALEDPERFLMPIHYTTVVKKS